MDLNPGSESMEQLSTMKHEKVFGPEQKLSKIWKF